MKYIAPLRWHMAAHGTLKQQSYKMQEIRIYNLLDIRGSIYSWTSVSGFSNQIFS